MPKQEKQIKERKRVGAEKITYFSKTKATLLTLAKVMRGRKINKPLRETQCVCMCYTCSTPEGPEITSIYWKGATHRARRPRHNLPSHTRLSWAFVLVLEVSF